MARVAPRSASHRGRQSAFDRAGRPVCRSSARQGMVRRAIAGAKLHHTETLDGGSEALPAARHQSAWPVACTFRKINAVTVALACRTRSNCPSITSDRSRRRIQHLRRPRLPRRGRRRECEPARRAREASATCAALRPIHGERETSADAFRNVTRPVRHSSRVRPASSVVVAAGRGRASGRPLRDRRVSDGRRKICAPRATSSRRTPYSACAAPPRQLAVSRVRGHGPRPKFGARIGENEKMPSVSLKRNPSGLHVPSACYSSAQGWL